MGHLSVVSFENLLRVQLQRDFLFYISLFGIKEIGGVNRKGF